MDIPMMVSHPSGVNAGTTCDEFVYTLDVPATVMAASQVEPAGEIQGQSLLPLVEGRDGFTSREYLTCRYVNSVWYKDAKSWYFSSVDFQDDVRLFDLEADVACQHNIAAQGADRIALAKERILADANGHLPHYKRQGRTDALGRPQFAEA